MAAASRLVGSRFLRGIEERARQLPNERVAALRRFPLARLRAPVHCGLGGEHPQLTDVETDVCFEDGRTKRHARSLRRRRRISCGGRRIGEHLGTRARRLTGDVEQILDGNDRTIERTEVYTGSRSRIRRVG